MCGIFGVIGNIPIEHQREAHLLLTNLFRTSVVRGKDASGFAAIHNEHNATLITDKRPISSPKFVKRCLKYKALKRDMPSIFIGHTRLSTGATPSRGRNNHPFNNNDYSMVHNGVIEKWQDVVKAHGITMRSETDSEVILRIVEKHKDTIDGVQSVVDTVPGGSSMAVALLRHNTNDDIRLSLFRNDGRPCFIMTAPYFRSIFFASTKHIISMAIKHTYREDADKRAKEYGLAISELPSFRYIEFGLNNHGNPYTVRKKDIKKPAPIFLPAFNHKKASCSQSSTFRSAANNSISLSDREYGLPSASNHNTQREANALIREANEASRILRLIQENPYITKSEISHWKKWRLQI